MKGLKVNGKAPLNADLKIERAIVHWPSLGVYEDQPETHVFALKTLSGKVLATGAGAALTAYVADRGYYRVAWAK